MGQWVKLESTTVLMSQVNSNSALDLFHSQNHRKHGTSLKVQKGKGHFDLLLAGGVTTYKYTYKSKIGFISQLKDLLIPNY